MIEPAPSNAPASGAAHAPAASRARGFLGPATVLAAAVALAALGSALPPRDPPLAARPETAQVEAVIPATAEVADAVAAPVLDPWPGTLGGPLSRWAWAGPATSADAASELGAPEASDPATPAAEGPPVAEPPRAVMTVPLPMPRPPELRQPVDPVRRAERPGRRQAALPPPPPPAEDDRSFLEKLFGIERGPALAYTALESRPAIVAPRPRLSPPLAPPSAAAEGGVAVYNIAARTVTLPGGERLEAHSGLGEMMDDPRNVHVRMRGATPPGTYTLTEREQPFHGVRAIRLTPVGGPEAIYGRVGLLAHTYMLGPSGASNGCISFRDYDRFLQAFLRGEIQRVVVVTGTSDPLPVVAQQGSAVRMARAGE
ncbi:DUF2778 domain-containing protein [Methylobacterium sp. NEAU 140]|uniref:tlde1 domain-containing protein n=1 Tax=Methylobacterium sp. NEAU 140 TaxID=3064945 RepID=UPI0027354403|nr:tlde1 domain-containing protein [Methylobacterium sp. NEAU 140]MDP4023498.1 DUF2778 domain-containing protein [Methylobacterium sp. NEAU 140]